MSSQSNEDAAAFRWVVKALALAIVLMALSLILTALDVPGAIVGVAVAALALLAVLYALPLLGWLQLRLQRRRSPHG